MESEAHLPIYSLAEWHFCPRSAIFSWLGAERRDEVTPAYQKMRQAHLISDKLARRDKNKIRIETAVKLIHTKLEISGRADAVEWRSKNPSPVEYKNCPSDPPKHIIAQVTLQAICLEEMFNCNVTHGWIFRLMERIKLAITSDIKKWVLKGVEDFRSCLNGGLKNFKKIKQDACSHCIYLNVCWPKGLLCKPQPHM